MKIISIQPGPGASSKDSFQGLLAEIDRAGCGKPDFMSVHYGVGHRASDLQAMMTTAFPATALHGGSSCLGVMSNHCMPPLDGEGLGALAIFDPYGSYGTSAQSFDVSPDVAAQQAALNALEMAGRAGEVPDMVWLTVTAGNEEAVLKGLRSMFGDDLPVYGGTAADNDISGQWSLFGPGGTCHNGVVVSVMFPSGGMSSSYNSGYAPLVEQGTVTRVEGRRLIEIDGQPAAAVYHQWTEGRVPMAGDTPLSVLAEATFWPLGRVTHEVAGVPFHLLAHPAIAHPDGSLEMFADLDEGDQLWQMHGSAQSLVSRASRVTSFARGNLEAEPAGALVVFCGGCMLAIQDRMHEVKAGIDESLEGVPWLGIFTFGEQGQLPKGPSRHGNLMISCTVFGH
ncbi:FIST C-terminal domain-containing protein [Halomonas sp. BLK-85]